MYNFTGSAEGGEAEEVLERDTLGWKNYKPSDFFFLKLRAFGAGLLSDEINDDHF